MINMAAVFKKQWKDNLKNSPVLIQFVMFPFLTVLMNNAMQMDDMPQNFFVSLFATMYIGMAPLTSMAAIVSEEKEKNTLRVLMMSNVKPQEYLLGVGGCIWSICILGSVVFCIEGRYQGKEAVAFLGIMAVGTLVSLIIGALIGVWSKSQMIATSVTVPVMMIFSFLPMLSMYNNTISQIAKFTYSEQISRMINQIQNLQVDVTSILVIGVNMVIALGLFVVVYKKRGLV